MVNHIFNLNGDYIDKISPNPKEYYVNYLRYHYGKLILTNKVKNMDIYNCCLYIIFSDNDEPKKVSIVKINLYTVNDIEKVLFDICSNELIYDIITLIPKYIII